MAANQCESYAACPGPSGEQRQSKRLQQKRQARGQMHVSNDLMSIYLQLSLQRSIEFASEQNKDIDWLSAKYEELRDVFNAEIRRLDTTLDKWHPAE